MNIPLVDLKAQYLAVKDEIDAAIADVVDSTWFVGGEQVRIFEEEFAAYCEAEHAVGVGNGTDALHLALQACGVGSGDVVITTPFTFTATAEAVVSVGAKPVFVDIDPVTYNLDPEKLKDTVEGLINGPLQAIIPVHLYGQPADMDPILEVAERYDLRVIEDAAQAHGARYKGRRAGSMGDIACFSFYPAKNLGAFGDAGAVVTNDSDLAEQVRLLRDHGRTTKYVHQVVGRNSRLDTLQAAVLRVKLRHLDRWNVVRRENADRYSETLQGQEMNVHRETADAQQYARSRQTALSKTVLSWDMILPWEADGVESVYHLYVVQVDDREGLRAHLSEQGVSTGVHYPVPLHLQPAFVELGYGQGDFPVAEAAAERVLSLPMYPELGDAAIERIATLVKSF